MASFNSIFPAKSDLIEKMNFWISQYGYPVGRNEKSEKSYKEAINDIIVAFLTHLDKSDYSRAHGPTKMALLALTFILENSGKRTKTSNSEERSEKEIITIILNRLNPRRDNILSNRKLSKSIA